MKRRKKPLSPNLLRLFLVLWILASLGYWIAGIVDLWDTRVHWDQRVNTPFRFDSDSRLVYNNGLQPEARAAGLAKNKARIAFPWMLYYPMRFMSCLPVWLTDPIFSRLPAKTSTGDQ